jgi:hypothetical protein
MRQKAIGLALALLFASGLFADPSRAQSGALVVPVCGTLPLAYKAGGTRPLTQDVNGNMCSSATLSGSTSNATSAVATSATNVPTVSYNYGFNGTTWDQLQVDGSKNLNVNCAVGCSGGSFNNNADGVATSSTNGQSAVWPYLWNGTTFDRWYGDETNGAFVNVKSIADGVDATLGAKDDGVCSTATGTCSAIALIKYNNNAAIAPVPGYYATAYNTCSQVTTTVAPICVDLNGNMYANISRYTPAQGATYSAQTFFPVMGLASTNAPTATTGDLWALSISPASGGVRIDLKDSAANTNPFNVTSTLATSGGYTTYFLQPTAGDNHTNIKNGAGQVYWVLAENNSATINYLRFYNAASGFNGCNSATNLITQIQIPASTSVGGVNIPLQYGIPFSTGISICVTSGYATTDTTNATATAISLTIGYN